MQLRFLAIFGDLEHRQEVKARVERTQPEFESVVSAGNMLIMTNRHTDVLPLPGGHGAILGKLFSRSRPSKPITAISKMLEDELLKTQGRAAVDLVWGAYVLIIALPQSADGFAIRDPSGGMPAYYVGETGLTMIASDIDLLQAASSRNFQVDYPALSRHLQDAAPDLLETALAGISELPPGYRLQSAAQSMHAIATWSPSSFLGPVFRHSPESEVENLRDIILDTLAAWRTAFPKALVPMSGGLDSSVVAVSLAHAGAVLCGLTMATDEPDGDERRYARLVAEHLNIPLIERNYCLDHVDVLKSISAHLPRPSGFVFGQSFNRVRAEVAEVELADAIFSGVGGDSVFCLAPTAAPLADQVLSEGINRDTFRTISALAKLTGRSVWSLCLSAGSLIAQQGSPVAGNPFLSEVTFRRASLNEIVGLPPGKTLQVESILHVRRTLEIYPRQFSYPLVTPLLSQPILEACLRIPSWRSCAEGRDRAVARLAMRDLLPSEVFERRTKGGPDAFAFDVIEANRAKIRRHLHDGLLAQNGIVSPSRIRHALDDYRPLHPPDHIYILELLESESWARAHTR